MWNLLETPIKLLVRFIAEAAVPLITTSTSPLPHCPSPTPPTPSPHVPELFLILFQLSLLLGTKRPLFYPPFYLPNSFLPSSQDSFSRPHPLSNPIFTSSPFSIISLLSPIPHVYLSLFPLTNQAHPFSLPSAVSLFPLHLGLPYIPQPSPIPPSLPLTHSPVPTPRPSPSTPD